MGAFHKALLIGGLTAAGIFLFATFILPILGFLIISTAISFIIKVVIKEYLEERRQEKEELKALRAFREGKMPKVNRNPPL